MKASHVYEQSDGKLTQRYYDELTKRGTLGIIAVNLFRAQKCSSRAKVYRGRRFKSAAYDRKQWSLGLLVEALEAFGRQLGIRFGWKEDRSQEWNPWVLYVDLPQGQVSFHSPDRGDGPDYPGEWDGLKASVDRILEFCDQVYSDTVADPPQISLQESA